MRRAVPQRQAERARQHAKVAGTAYAAQLAPVQRAVMGRAQRDEIVRAMAATFGARSDVMQIQKGGVPAAGDATAPLIAAQHRAAQRRRDVLLGARELAGRSAVAASG